MRRGWLFLLMLALAAILASCGGAIAPAATPTSSLPQLASTYTGSTTSGLTKNTLALNLTVSQQSAGTFQGQMLLGPANSNLVYACQGTISTDRRVEIDATGPTTLQFIGTLASDGTMSGTLKLTSDDPGSTWTLSPAPA